MVTYLGKATTATSAMLPDLTITVLVLLLVLSNNSTNLCHLLVLTFCDAVENVLFIFFPGSFQCSVNFMYDNNDSV